MISVGTDYRKGNTFLSYWSENQNSIKTNVCIKSDCKVQL